MDAIAILLRFIHIGAAFAWVGSAFFVLAILDPMLVRMGPAEANRLHRHLVLRSKFGVFFPVTAILTVVGGLALYWWINPSIKALGSTQGIVFHVGVVFGILALIWGGSMEGRLVGKMRTLSKTIQGTPTPAQEQEFTAIAHKLSNANKVSGVLLVIGMFGMATFQYF